MNAEVACIGCRWYHKGRDVSTVRQSGRMHAERLTPAHVLVEVEPTPTHAGVERIRDARARQVAGTW